MNHIEVMKQALEALELSAPVQCGQSDALYEQELMRHRAAKSALRQAIQEAALQAITDFDQQAEQDARRYNREDLDRAHEVGIARGMALAEQAEQAQPVACGACNGSGRMVRDPDIGTDQECFVCDGSGQNIEAAHGIKPKCPNCGKVNPAEIHTCSPQAIEVLRDPAVDQDRSAW